MRFGSLCSSNLLGSSVTLAIGIERYLTRELDNLMRALVNNVVVCRNPRSAPAVHGRPSGTTRTSDIAVLVAEAAGDTGVGIRRLI